MQPIPNCVLMQVFGAFWTDALEFQVVIGVEMNTNAGWLL